MPLDLSEASLKDRRGLRNPRTLRRLGIILYLLSFLTPTWDFEGMGIGAFIMAPRAAAYALSDVTLPHEWKRASLGYRFAVRLACERYGVCAASIACGLGFYCITLDLPSLLLLLRAQQQS